MEGSSAPAAAAESTTLRHGLDGAVPVKWGWALLDSGHTAGCKIIPSSLKT